MFASRSAAKRITPSSHASVRPTSVMPCAASVNSGTTLKPGDYKVQWDGTGPNVELSIIQGKNVVAKVPAHVVDLPSPSANDAAVTKKQDNGPNSLASIRFQGKKFALDLDQASDEMQGGSSK